MDAHWPTKHWATEGGKRRMSHCVLGTADDSCSDPGLLGFLNLRLIDIAGAETHGWPLPEPALRGVG